MNNYFRIGSIVRVHGVRGAVKIIPETDSINRFKKCKTVFVENGSNYTSYQVESVQLLNNAAVIKLSDVDSVEVAQTLVGKFLCVKREDAVQLPKDSYFIEDLIGCSVYDTNKTHIGTITDVLNYVANDVLVIDNGRIEVPFLKKLIYQVSVKEKMIIFYSGVFSEVAYYAN